jgi:hypothetical protein
MITILMSNPSFVIWQQEYIYIFLPDLLLLKDFLAKKLEVSAFIS